MKKDQVNLLHFHGEESSKIDEQHTPPAQFPMDARLAGGALANTYPMQPNYAYYNQQGIELARKADLAAIDIAKTAQKEQILTAAITERKARSLDLQVRHSNRQVEMRLGFDGAPIIHKEMLAEQELEKKIANIRCCRSVIYLPDLWNQTDKIHRILEVAFYNDSTKRDDKILMDITNPDEKVFMKLLRSKGVRFLCGRRQQLEYAGKLLEGLIECATEVIIPRSRGFSYFRSDNVLKIVYVSEQEITWRGMVALWG